MQETLRQRQYFKYRIFKLAHAREFDDLCLEVFRYQALNIPVYKRYLHFLGLNPQNLIRVSQIPFLPISFFKTETVSRTGSAERIFSSSGTSGMKPGQHFVEDLSLYEESFTHGFRKFYGPAEEYCVLALLPSYLEREGSSLIYMAGHMIRHSADPDSGFYLNEFEELHQLLLKKIAAKKKVLLLGVTFALLDFAESYTLPPNDVVVMETGGMKGRRKELLRQEVHNLLKPALGVDQIHSEYGMTELLSQAYSQSGGRFFCPPWMKVEIRQVDDPFSSAAFGKTGGINVIDLANIDSCAFVETQDLGRLYEDGSFEVMGRFDNSDIRGCNLMVI